jgi:molecular chaperone GrpE
VRTVSKIESRDKRMTQQPNGPPLGDLVATGETAERAGAMPGADVAGVADDIAQQLARVESEVAELKDAWLRAKAETDNVRKQAQTDIAKAHKYAVERFAEDLLPVKDALEQTLAAGDVSLETLKAGAALTLKALQASFERAQVVEINPVGEKYDPHRHQAMQLVESDQPPNTVVDVFQKGYLINDRTLRPALVTVAKGKADARS